MAERLNPLRGAPCRANRTDPNQSSFSFIGSGVLSEVDPPVPIPNTAVKRLSVDDTRGVALRENRPMPGPKFAPQPRPADPLPPGGGGSGSTIWCPPPLAGEG